MDSRHQFRGRLLPSLPERDLETVAFAFQRCVAQPDVGANKAAKPPPNSARRVGESPLRRPRLVASERNRSPVDPLAPQRQSVLWLRFGVRARILQTADVCLIYLDSAGQPVAVWVYHDAAQFMQPRPGCFVTLQPSTVGSEGAPAVPDCYPTTPPGTKVSGALGCPEKSSRRSPNPGSCNSNIAAEPQILAAVSGRHSADNENHQAFHYSPAAFAMNLPPLTMPCPARYLEGGKP